MKKIFVLIIITIVVMFGAGYYLIRPYLPEKQAVKQTVKVNADYMLKENTIKYTNKGEPFVQIVFPKTLEPNKNITLTATTKEKNVSYVWEIDYEGSRIKFSPENKITFKMDKPGNYSIYVSIQNLNGDTMSGAVKYANIDLQ